METVLGKQRNQLDAVAERWGFPINGSPCDLVAVLVRLSEFLKKYGPLLKVLMDDEGEGDENALGVRYLRAKIDKTEEDAKAQRLRNEQKESRLCDRESIMRSLALLADRIVKAGERAQRKWGDEGYEFFQDLAAGFESDLRGVFDASDDVGAEIEAVVEDGDGDVQSVVAAEADSVDP